MIKSCKVLQKDRFCDTIWDKRAALTCISGLHQLLNVLQGVASCAAVNENYSTHDSKLFLRYYSYLFQI
jgi:hypothetical protein